MSQAAQRVVCGEAEQAAFSAGISAQRPDSRLPTPDSRLPTPDSRLPSASALPSVIAFLLGAVLSSAAVLKGHDLATRPVLDDAMLPARWLWLAVADFEAVLGAWLLLVGFAPRWVWKLTIACFAALGCAAAWKGMSGAESCDCFGRLSANLNPWYMVLVDVAAVGGALLCWPQVSVARTALPGYARWLAAGSIVVALPASIAIGINAPRPAMLSTSGEIAGLSRTVLLKPEEWIGKRFPLLEHFEFGQERANLEMGTWGIVLYARDCPKCEAIRAELEGLAGRLAASHAAEQLAFVEVPIDGHPSATPSHAWHGGVAARLARGRDWFVETPTVVVVRDSVVRQVFVRIEPSGVASLEASIGEGD